MLDQWNLNRQPEQPFIPQPFLRNAYVQSAVSALQVDIPATLVERGIPFFVDGGVDETGQDDGSVRLLAYFTPSVSNAPTKGAVILLHGWEGTSHSNFGLIAMRELTNAGYHIIRLNLRDHGPGIHAHPQALNPGIFLGTLLSEAVTAIRHCAEFMQPLPVFLAGLSMGGNFALRVAIYQQEERIPNLEKVIAINPAVNPEWSTMKIDANPVLRRLFREPWLAQLMAKQRFFPHRYDLYSIQKLKSLRAMTDWLVQYLGVYQDDSDYFADYAVLGDATEKLDIPAQIITSMDDMVVPVADIYGLAPGPNLMVDIHPYGGHVGYMHGSPLRHYGGKLVLNALESV